MKHWRYLKYVIRHKLFVLQEGLKLGVSLWQLLGHDMSKFRSDEWQPYAEFFYGYFGGSWYEVPNEPKAVDSSPYTTIYSGHLVGQRLFREQLFNEAWLMHLHRNPHHWQYWVLREDSGATIALKMPERYALEMVADWKGAGRAIHGKDETRDWYLQNHQKMLLHPDTRAYVEDVLQLGALKPTYKTATVS